MDERELSKYISYILRHNPDSIGAVMDEHGYICVDDLINGINKTNYIDMDLLNHIVETDNKNRYSFNADKTKIRANQGHSIPVDLELKPITPPDILYHGTGLKYVDSIDKIGLIPKSRNYVHLSSNYNTAVNVGKRHGTPVVYEIDTKAMLEDGYSFYRSVNGVWLIDKVDIKYLKRL